MAIFSAPRASILLELHCEIGDADHGLKMNRGFSKVVGKLPAIADKDIGFILEEYRHDAILSSVGGASGPLLNLLYLRRTTAPRHGKA
ncbi:DAK2 domain-containing protein [Escherichia coli]